MSEEIKNTNVENKPEDCRVIINMTKEMEEQYKAYKELIVSSINSSYNVSEDILEILIPYTKEDIANLDIDKIKEILDKYSLNDVSATEYIIDNGKISSKSEEESLREAINYIKEQSIQVFSMKAEVENIKNESQDILNEYIEYASSEKVRIKRNERLEAMKKAVAESNDTTEKRSMERMIATMEAAQSLSFLFTRFQQLGDKEVKSIVDSFFSPRKGAYVINRFKKVIPKFGFGESLFKYFFNLEENFLDESYYPYNNLFLFIYMRFVAHSDPYSKSDKMYVQSLTSSMANLVYHRFQNNIIENSFVDTIKKVIDKFEDYRELFTNENSTQPNHPHRIDADNRRNSERRAALIAKMNELQITGYDENASADVLQQFMNDKLNEMIKAQTPEKEIEDIKEESPSEDSVIE